MSPRAFWTMNYDQPSCAIDQEVWTRIRTFVLQCSTMISRLARSSWTFVLQCSTVIYFSASELSTSKNGPKYALITQAFLCRWLLFVKGTYLFQTQVRLCQLFFFSSQTNIEFASLLELSLLHFSFSRLSLTELSMFIDSQHWMFESVVPLAMFSFL